MYNDRRMRRLIVVCAWLAIAACESSATAAHPSPSPSIDRSPTSAATPLPGGCGSTQVYKGGEPDWLTRAGDNNNPNDLPYFITSPPIAAGFLFAYPLKGGRSTSPNNKILWVVGPPRNGHDLKLVVTLVGVEAAGEVFTFPADSGPGAIYPSVVDVASPGCWHFDLTWGANKAAADLNYT